MRNVLWHIDPFLGNDSKTNKITDVARQQILNKQWLNYIAEWRPSFLLSMPWKRISAAAVEL
jgi:hypothetical protein